jgi:hypothetical protein
MMQDIEKQSEFDIADKTKEILSRNPGFTLDML